MKTRGLMCLYFASLCHPDGFIQAPNQQHTGPDTQSRKHRLGQALLHRLGPVTGEPFYTELHARSWSSGARRRVNVSDVPSAQAWGCQKNEI